MFLKFWTGKCEDNLSLEGNNTQSMFMLWFLKSINLLIFSHIIWGRLASWSLCR